MSATPARRAAYRVLLDVARGRADLPQAIARARTHLDDRRDQSLAAAIAIGTLRWRAALDHVIGHFARRPLDALDPEVLTILRLSAYQIVHLTRVPVPAAVADGVELVREARKKSAAGFANAVLRSVARERAALPLPTRPEDPADDRSRDALLDYLSITLSHPRWLAARWLARYGADATEKWLRFDNEEAPLTLRANTLRIPAGDLAARLRDEGIVTTATRYADAGLIVVSGNPVQSPLEREGLFVFQDEASQLVGAMLPVQPGDVVLDACASPGGKTAQLAAGIQDRGVIVASDVRPKRVALLLETIARLGARSVRVTQADFTMPPPFGPVFDAVLLDAPCSGLGTLRRDPDIKWRRREEDLPVLAAAELKMLEHAADTVRPGGYLAYATCSSEPEEDEDVAEAFLRARSDFRAAPRPGDALPLPLDRAGHLRTYPHEHGLEAFFAALFQRLPSP